MCPPQVRLYTLKVKTARYSKSVLFIPLLLINLELKPMIGMVRTGYS
jgi:hypothetical protein